MAAISAVCKTISTISPGLVLPPFWSTPLLENDQPYSSYHGYAITDHYAIDPRFGSNDDYLAFASLCQARGIKVIKDLVFNHVGHQHWFVQDIPSRDWVHQFDTYTGSNHASPSLMDPNASYYDRRTMLNGWFDYSMPDLNQQNPQLAAYLIQHAIWWVEYAGVDGYRLDTYQFCDQDFMREMGRRLLKEYPGFYYFGETWVQSGALQSSFVANSLTAHPASVMPGVADFQWAFAVREAVKGNTDRYPGAQRLYFTLSDDFLYRDPMQNVIFLDNHDMGRIYTDAGQNMELAKSALSILMTSRGIPCVYYGTEFGFAGEQHPDGLVRPDFPGGWEEDEINLFDPQQRDTLQSDLYDHFVRLTSYRRQSEALRHGLTTQYAPSHGVYAYFRHTQDDMVLVLFNPSDEQQNVPTLTIQRAPG